MSFNKSHLEPPVGCECELPVGEDLPVVAANPGELENSRKKCQKTQERFLAKGRLYEMLVKEIL